MLTAQVLYNFEGALQSIANVFWATWWLFLPIILLFILRDVWLTYVHDRTVRGIKWALLEIKIPKEILKTPKSMEQVFAAVYADYSHGWSSVQQYYLGDVDSWYSFEVVGYAGGIHFYLFLSEKLRNNMEAAIYSQYPQAEIHEVEDYTELLPKVLPNESYDLWGTDLILGKDSYYPIRTYPYFEEVKDEKRVDPIAALTEVMSGLKCEERLWWQVVVSPSTSERRINNQWKEEGQKKIAEITGQKKEVKKGIGDALADWLRNLIWAPLESPTWGEAVKKETTAALKFLSPAEQEVVKAIDSKTSKLGCETTVRFIYMDKKETFTTANATAVMGTVRQFNTQNLNYFKPGKELTSVTGWKAEFLPLYKKLKLYSKKKKLFSNYKLRKLGTRMVGKYRRSTAKIHTFNTEELATIYHFPTIVVEAPKLRRLESKKGGPPATLPIE